MRNSRDVLSVGLAAATLAVVLTYVLGAPALLQTPQAETGHSLFMSMFTPLIQGITGGHASMSQMHGGPASDSQMQGMNQGFLGNNMLGSPAGMAAAGLAAVVVMGVIPLATAAFVISSKQRSFLVAALLAAGGVILMMLPLANMNFVIPGPIIGVVVGLAILGLGVAKGIGMASIAVVAARYLCTTNSKLILEVGLAAAALFLATNVIGVHRQLASLVGISAMGMSVAVFAVSLGQRSYVAAGLLGAAGIIYIIRGLIALAAFGAITFPSPITGVIIGLVILGLGVAKSIRTAMAVTVALRSTIIAAAVTGAITAYLVAGHTIPVHSP